MLRHANSPRRPFSTIWLRAQSDVELSSRCPLWVAAGAGSLLETRPHRMPKDVFAPYPAGPILEAAYWPSDPLLPLALLEIKVDGRAVFRPVLCIGGRIDVGPCATAQCFERCDQMLFVIANRPV